MRRFRERQRAHSFDRRGAMLVLIAVLLTLFMVVLAFSVDIALIQLARTELRTATDAAANAAANALADTGDEDAAIAAGTRLALANPVLDRDLELVPTDFEFGRSTRQTSGKFTFSPDGTPANTVRVSGERTRSSRSGSIPLLFSQALGVPEFETGTQATASFSQRDIALVVDRSGSMSGGRWQGLLGAVDTFVTTLQETAAEERVGLASYSTTATGDVAVTPDLTQIQTGIRRLRPRGWTAIGRGIAAGRGILNGSTRASFVERTLIVMTDGRHNTGEAPRFQAARAAAEGITVHTITFGSGADIGRMRTVADIGGGRHYHAADAAQLRAVYREIALALRTVMTE